MMTRQVANSEVFILRSLSLELYERVMKIGPLVIVASTNSYHVTLPLSGLPFSGDTVYNLSPKSKQIPVLSPASPSEGTKLSVDSLEDLLAVCYQFPPRAI